MGAFLLWATVPAVYVASLLVLRALGGPRGRVPSEAAKRTQDGDPFVGAERCRACGSWQARHLVRADCWRCHAPLDRTVEAQTVDP